MATNSVEPLLDPANERHVILPIKFQKTWDWHKKHLSQMWIVEEIQDKLVEDYNEFQKLNDDEKHFIKMVLAFFAASDGIVSDNISSNFAEEITIPEARAFYTMQNLIETVHNETYSLMITTLVREPVEQSKLLNALNEIPVIKKLADWTFKWMNPDTASFVERLVAFTVIEGVFFSGPFAAIFWLRSQGKMPGLGKANEFISRDEGFHRDFGAHLYRDLVQNKLTDARVKEIVSDGTAIAVEFVTESLPVDLIGMNKVNMTKYVKYVADHLVESLGHTKIYNETNPFTFISVNSYDIKSNFFEDKSTAYKKNMGDTNTNAYEEVDDF